MRRIALIGVTGLAAALWGGCADPSPDESEVVAQATDPTTTNVSDIPFIDAKTNQRILGELLAKPTAAGETTAIYVRLPDTDNSALKGTLVRIVGPTDAPQVLFRADALVQMGIIKQSPGSDFFVAFATLSPDQLTTLKANQDTIAKGTFGRTTTESVLFTGRAITARTINPTVDPTVFNPGGGPVTINGCAVRPVSTQQAWDQSLFIRSPQVVLDPTRTWDPCTGAGTPGGVWTFAHLMREMSIGSTLTPEDFVKNWLSLWLNNYTVNSDVVVQRATQMFNQVIAPWEAASGGTATLATDPLTGQKVVNLTVPLNLDIAPFELEAIVNRIDLGDTTTGAASYSGTTNSIPVTSGELRFIFDVVQPTAGSCGKKLFTTIFEYGVPGAGCNKAVAWARQWTSLQAMPGFTPAYLAQLQSMTESVVLNGAAPTKGNKNAINQIRTNEIALGGVWELREFTLSTENPAAPVNGPLRPHTVAQTINDGAFAPIPGTAAVNNFMVSLPVVGTPPTCDASYTVPFTFGTPFRGGNSLVNFGHWNFLGGPTGTHNICARHIVSLNNCGGCHKDESGTTGGAGNTIFTHVSATSAIPVSLSKFLTGGGPGLVYNVPDPQLGAPVWQFADLERRFQRLFDISHCTSCITVRPGTPVLISQISQLSKVLPIDPTSDVQAGPIGPITSLDTAKSILDLRLKNLGDPADQTADFLRPAQSFAE